ncbi:lipoprotein [Streptomyces sodiiphilus]|uniref:Lipoprotein n=2 Tax=Streptomyces sodiiphilus TaxID=226217 RepID=A0ABN2PV69_9ACTN
MVVRQHGRTGRNAVVAAGCAGLLLALLAVSGCSEQGAAADSGGGAVTRAEPQEVLRQAADVLAGTGSSQARTAMRMASGGTRITLHGEGGFDYTRGVGELLVSLPNQEEPVTELFVDGALYMKNRGAGVPADKWVRLETAELSDGNLVTGGATHPMAAAELLRGVQQAAELGTKEVDGEILWRYQGVTDIAVAAEAAQGRAGEQLAAAIGGFMDTAVPFEAYVDGNGLLRKVRHRFRFASSSAGFPDGIDVVSTVTVYGFGTPVRVALPEPGDIYAGTIGASVG